MTFIITSSYNSDHNNHPQKATADHLTRQDCSLYTVGRLEDRHYAFAFPKGQHKHCHQCVFHHHRNQHYHHIILFSSYQTQISQIVTKHKKSFLRHVCCPLLCTLPNFFFVSQSFGTLPNSFPHKILIIFTSSASGPHIPNCLLACCSI